jgi:hypothetical protein
MSIERRVAHAVMAGHPAFEKIGGRVADWSAARAASTDSSPLKRSSSPASARQRTELKPLPLKDPHN